jgi:hypothetical protein
MVIDGEEPQDIRLTHYYYSSLDLTTYSVDFTYNALTILSQGKKKGQTKT